MPLRSSLTAAHGFLYAHEICGSLVYYRFSSVVHVKHCFPVGAHIVNSNLIVDMKPPKGLYAESRVNIESWSYSALLMRKVLLVHDEHSCWTSKAKFSQHWKWCWISPCVCECVRALLFEIGSLMSGFASESMLCTDWSRTDHMLWCLAVPSLQLQGMLVCVSTLAFLWLEKLLLYRPNCTCEYWGFCKCCFAPFLSMTYCSKPLVYRLLVFSFITVAPSLLHLKCRILLKCLQLYLFKY